MNGKEYPSLLWISHTTGNVWSHEDGSKSWHWNSEITIDRASAELTTQSSLKAEGGSRKRRSFSLTLLRSAVEILKSVASTSYAFNVKLNQAIRFQHMGPKRTLAAMSDFLHVIRRLSISVFVLFSSFTCSCKLAISLSFCASSSLSFATFCLFTSADDDGGRGGENATSPTWLRLESFTMSSEETDASVLLLSYMLMSRSYRLVMFFESLYMDRTTLLLCDESAPDSAEQTNVLVPLSCFGQKKCWRNVTLPAVNAACNRAVTISQPNTYWDKAKCWCRNTTLGHFMPYVCEAE